jgi:ribosome-associated protein
MPQPLELAPGWVIPAQDLSVRHARSSGPGGQNVNKVASKVELRFALESSLALSPAQKQRLAKAFPSHVTAGGEFVITSDRFRSQPRNHADALTRLAEMILSIRRAPRKRIATKPSKGAKERRLTEKRHQAERKRRRSADD